MKKFLILTFLVCFTHAKADELAGVWIGIDADSNSWAKLTISKDLEGTIELIPLGLMEKIVVKKVKVSAPDRKGMNFKVKLENLGSLNTQLKIKEFNLSFNKKLRHLKINEKLHLNLNGLKIDHLINMNLVPLEEFKNNYKSLIKDKEKNQKE